MELQGFYVIDWSTWSLLQNTVYHFSIVLCLFYVEIYVDMFLAIYIQFICQKLQLKKFMLFQREVGGVE